MELVLWAVFLAVAVSTIYVLLAIGTKPMGHPAPRKQFSELREFLLHLEGALEARYELCQDHAATPCDVLKSVLDSVTEARKEMDW